MLCKLYDCLTTRQYTQNQYIIKKNFFKEKLLLKFFLYLTQNIGSKIAFLGLPTKVSRKEYSNNVREHVSGGVTQTKVREATAVKPRLTSPADTSYQRDLGLKLLDSKVLLKCC